MVVQVVICKCHPKFRPGGTETGTSAGGEGQEYEVVDGGITETGILAGGEGQEYEMVVGGYGYEGGVVMREQLGNQAFELQQNEAYGTYSSS